jgi:hypothetical protein
MTTETLFVVSPQSCERWDIQKRKLNADPQLAEAFAQNVARKNPSLTAIGGDYGMAGVAMLNEYELWSVRVLKLGLTAPFFLKDGIHTPAFADSRQPTLSLFWTVPDDMRLVFGVTVLKDRVQHMAGDHYLVAFDKKGEMWRLPLSNLYANCKLCHGQDNTRLPTSLEVVNKCCTLFSKSGWNQDLYGDDAAARQNTGKMFRFKPTDTGFEQLPIEVPSGKSWTALCQKVSVESLNQQLQAV